MDDELKLPTSAQLAVLGQPISHSLSPKIHVAAYEAMGLQWQYNAIECGAADLEELIAERTGGRPGPPWRGFSLTMPLKEEAYRLSKVHDPVAIESGVVNTMLSLADGHWAGFNTDVDGLAAALTDADLDVSNTIVLGAGATAVSAVLAARSLGASRVTVVARRKEPAEMLADRFNREGADAVGGTSFRVRGVTFEAFEADVDAAHATVVISTLPGTAAHEFTAPRELMKLPLFDVAYDPWPSPLASRWRLSGGIAHAGIGMLIHQALLQVRIFVAGDPSSRLEDEDRVLAAMRLAASRGVEE